MLPLLLRPINHNLIPLQAPLTVRPSPNSDLRMLLKLDMFSHSKQAGKKASKY